MPGVKTGVLSVHGSSATCGRRRKRRDGGTEFAETARRSHSNPPFRPNKIVLSVPSGDWCLGGWETGTEWGGEPTVPRSERGRGARALVRRPLTGAAVAVAASSAPSPGCAGTPSGESGCSGRSGGAAAAGDRSVRFRHVSCSMGLRCTSPIYSEPGVWIASGEGEPSAAGEARYRLRRMEVPLAMRACREGGASPGRGVAGGDPSGEPSSGLLAGVAVAEKSGREAGRQTDSRRECTGETAAEERRDVSRELHALPNTLLERLLIPLLHTLLTLLLARLPSFGCITVLENNITFFTVLGTFLSVQDSSILSLFFH